MRARPVDATTLPPLVADLLDERLGALPVVGGRRVLRVAVDAAPAAQPGRFADALVEPLRARGRAALRVSADGFLRPASLRYEFGRQDPDAYYDDRLDLGGLDREVLRRLGPGGDGRFLPSLWDARRDRATRAAYVAAPAEAVLLLDGSLLLGRGLALDLVVHLHLSPGALRRRTPAAERWTLPAFARYDRTTAPVATADVVLRWDDPQRPAWVTGS